MFQLLTLLTGAWGGDLCLNAVPPPPPDVSPTTALWDGASIALRDLPRALVPVGWSSGDPIRPRGLFYDDEGRIYRIADVERVLATLPQSQGAYLRYVTSDPTVRLPPGWSEERAGEEAAVRKGLALLSATSLAGLAVEMATPAWPPCPRNQVSMTPCMEPPGPLSERFGAALCIYNQYADAAVELFNAPPREPDVDLPPGVPSSAVPFTEALWSEAGRQQPSSACWAEDIGVVWAFVSALRSRTSVRDAVLGSRAPSNASAAEILRPMLGEVPVEVRVAECQRQVALP